MSAVARIAGISGVRRRSYNHGGQSSNIGRIFSLLYSCLAYILWFLFCPMLWYFGFLRRKTFRGYIPLSILSFFARAVILILLIGATAMYFQLRSYRFALSSNVISSKPEEFMIEGLHYKGTDDGKRIRTIVGKGPTIYIRWGLKDEGDNCAAAEEYAQKLQAQFKDRNEQNISFCSNEAQAFKSIYMKAWNERHLSKIAQFNNWLRRHGY